MRAWSTSSARQCRLFLFYGVCIFSSLVSLAFLVWILWTLIDHGVPNFHFSIFTEITPPPGQAGGLRNAIFGSLIMTGLGILMAAPVGILVATFLVDFSGKRRIAKVVRFINDILLSAPSIVIGLFVYAIVVKPLHHFSGLAGSIALAVIALPMIVRTTEDVLYLVSPLLKESAVALGIPKWRVITTIVYKVAVGGLLTGCILALARIAGETAPLLFTALNNQFNSLSLLQPMANIPVTIFQYAMSPYQGWQDLAWAGALLITVAILLFNLLARWVLREKHK